MTPAFKLGLPHKTIAQYGLAIGDKVTITMDVSEERHLHPWSQVNRSVPEADEALKLGICMTFKVKDQSNPSFRQTMKPVSPEDSASGIKIAEGLESGKGSKKQRIA